MSTSLLSTVDAKEQFTDMINRVAHNNERIVLTRRGKQIAALVSLEDFNLLLTTEDKLNLQEAINALKETRQDGAVSLEKLKEVTGI